MILSRIRIINSAHSRPAIPTSFTFQIDLLGFRRHMPDSVNIYLWEVSTLRFYAAATVFVVQKSSAMWSFRVHCAGRILYILRKISV